MWKPVVLAESTLEPIRVARSYDRRVYASAVRGSVVGGERDTGLPRPREHVGCHMGFLEPTLQAAAGGGVSESPTAPHADCVAGGGRGRTFPFAARRP